MANQKVIESAVFEDSKKNQLTVEMLEETTHIGLGGSVQRYWTLLWYGGLRGMVAEHVTKEEAEQRFEKLLVEASVAPGKRPDSKWNLVERTRT